MRFAQQFVRAEIERPRDAVAQRIECSDALGAVLQGPRETLLNRRYVAEEDVLLARRAVG